MSFNGTSIVQGYNGESNFYNLDNMYIFNLNNVNVHSDFIENVSVTVYRRNTDEPRQNSRQDLRQDTRSCEVGVVVEVEKVIGKCTICLEDMKEGDSVRFLECLHKYHKNCVDSWLSRHSNSCPECRHET